MSCNLSTLEQGQVLVDLDRLDNPEYFSAQFSCPALQQLFKKNCQAQQISENKIIINHFYDRLLDVANQEKTLYVRLKWLLILHTLIQNFPQKDVMFNYVHKALELYLTYYRNLQQKFGPYEKYLSKTLFRPYIQYLTKFCQLYMKEEMTQEQLNQSQDVWRLDKWCQEYNFMLWSLETFNRHLHQAYEYFEGSFPFLNSIGPKIYKNLKQHMLKLKKDYIKTNDIKKFVTFFQLSQMQKRVNNFQESNNNFLDGLNFGIPEEDISDFMTSPLKPKKRSFMALTNCSISEVP